jgi:uncharacterized membrane protein YphA (DoxX/SURF4 family)
MESILRNPYILLISRLVLGIVFIIASVDKIYNPDAFAASIEAYKLMPYSIINILAVIIPWMELFCGIFLLGGVYVRGSSSLLSILLVVFMFAIISALVRELKIDCGCFGKEHATPVTWMKVVEDIGLFVLGIHLFLFWDDKSEPEKISHG